MSNEAIAQQFLELADLTDFVGDSPFKSRAYRQAAQVLESLQSPIETLAENGADALAALPGIGEAIAEKILAYLQTGTIPKREELLQKVPAGVLEVMGVPGIGAKTARLLYQQLGVHDLASLRNALLSGAVDHLPHFSPRKRERLLRLVELKHKSQRRTPLGLALPRGRDLLQAIQALDGAKQAMLCGSARRMQEDVGDLDYLVAADAPQTVVEAFVRLPAVAEVYAQGISRAQVFLKDGMQVDLKIVPPERWGAGMLYLTGSRAHSIRLRQRAIERGLKLNEYGVWRGTECLADDTEEAVYAALGLPYIPPPLREDTGEIEAAEQGRLPTLVALGDIRGDLQSHSHWSDGLDTLETLAQAAGARGYEYLAITDHAHQFADREAFEQRRREIEQLNQRTGGRPYLINAVEVNILPDGSLNAPEWMLHAAEFVLAGIHEAHGQPRDGDDRAPDSRAGASRRRRAGAPHRQALRQTPAQRRRLGAGVRARPRAGQSRRNQRLPDADGSADARRPTAAAKRRVGLSGHGRACRARPAGDGTGGRIGATRMGDPRARPQHAPT
jgi:DNA polymerase (family 10)